MPTAPLKKVTEELGIAPDDMVRYYKKGNKAIIEVKIKQTKIHERKDPIFELGKDPVSTGIADGSINHNKYIYRNNE